MWSPPTSWSTLAGRSSCVTLAWAASSSTPWPTPLLERAPTCRWVSSARARRPHPLFLWPYPHFPSPPFSHCAGPALGTAFPLALPPPALPSEPRAVPRKGRLGDKWGPLCSLARSFDTWRVQRLRVAFFHPIPDRVYTHTPPPEVRWRLVFFKKKTTTFFSTDPNAHLSFRHIWTETVCNCFPTPAKPSHPLSLTTPKRSLP